MTNSYRGGAETHVYVTEVCAVFWGGDEGGDCNQYLYIYITINGGSDIYGIYDAVLFDTDLREREKVCIMYDTSYTAIINHHQLNT